MTQTAIYPVHAETWTVLRAEAEALAAREDILADIINTRVLSADRLPHSLAMLLSEKLNRPACGADTLQILFREIYDRSPHLEDAALADLAAVLRQDPAARDLITPYLFFKGFHALQTYRLAHVLWHEGRIELAQFLQSRTSMVFGVDIHPAARIGKGVVFDHASGIVVGETARIGNNVLILHGVTLGGKGHISGDRHPIIEDDVTIGACAQILGRITIGKGSYVAAGSLVLKPVEPNTTVAGVPAKVIREADATPAS